jgi:glycerol-3-phosphate dehydrogenase
VWAGGTGGTGAPEARLVPSKGVHLVFAPGTVRTKVAMVLPSAAGDGRFLFVVPWEDRVYAGTTDTPYSGDLDHPAVDEADRDYILAAVAANFPGVTGRDVVASWAGLRPLLGQGTGQGDTSTADLSRRHAVFEEPPGLFTITGGKLTTYRAMAEDLTDRVQAVGCHLSHLYPSGSSLYRSACMVRWRGPRRLPRQRRPGWGCRRGPERGWCSVTATTGARPPP